MSVYDQPKKNSTLKLHFHLSYLVQTILVNCHGLLFLTQAELKHHNSPVLIAKADCLAAAPFRGFQGCHWF